jgi:energy-coupling factor transporter ATP-binding protein EcfA2
MFINRMRFLNIKALNRDIPEGGGALPEPDRRRLLLQGANGSGKSTILESILTLWKFWGEWLEGAPPPSEHLRHYLANPHVTGALAAIEIVGIPNAQALWIGIGHPDQWRALREAHPEAIFAGLVGMPPPYHWSLELPSGDWLEHRHRSLAGSEPFPNIVYFPPEGRTISAPEKPRGEIIDMTQFNWTAVYDPGVSLDSILLTVKAQSPERFEECLRLVNLALEHRQKRIIGFGLKGRLVVEGRTTSGVSFQHAIEELSSGERQLLLLVGFVVAFLRPGGIVLLDEPDLHIHIAMVDQLMETMERVVQERNGQLIVASHSTRVWEWFAREEERIELSPWLGVPA